MMRSMIDRRNIISRSLVLLMFAAFSVCVSAQVPTPTPDINSATELPNDPPPIAPDFQAPVRPLPTSERVGVDVANQLPLTLEQAIEMALKNNNDIDASRNDVKIAEFNLRGAKGIYDPLIDAGSYYESRTTPTASTIGGATNGAVTVRQFYGNTGLSGFSPYKGGNYSAAFTSSRTNTSNLNATLNPQYPSELTFQYTQPLLRNFGIDANRRAIEIAKKNLSLTDSQFRQKAIEVVTLVEQNYWNLAFSLRNLQVQIDAVRQARTQLDSNQRLVAKGVLAPIDIVAATAQITTLEQNVYSAQEDVTRAENSLKTLLADDRSNDIWSRPLTPISPITLDPPPISLEVAISKAMENRPELEQFATSREINAIDRKYFRNQTKPQIDVYGAYTMSGLAGAATPPRTTTPSALTTRVNELSLLSGLPELPVGTTTSSVPPNLVGGYFNSLGNLIGQDFPTYRAGVTISLPWGNTTAKANLGRTLVEGDRLKNLSDQAENIIEAEVRNAIQAIRSAESRLASALAARTAAEKLAESEERQFKAGTTTFYLVLQRQTELIVARSRELQAQTDLNRAIAEYQRATGTTLTVNNISIK